MRSQWIQAASLIKTDFGSSEMTYHPRDPRPATLNGVYVYTTNITFDPWPVDPWTHLTHDPWTVDPWFSWLIWLVDPWPVDPWPVNCWPLTQLTHLTHWPVTRWPFDPWPVNCWLVTQLTHLTRWPVTRWPIVICESDRIWLQLLATSMHIHEGCITLLQVWQFDVTL